MNRQMTDRCGRCFVKWGIMFAAGLFAVCLGWWALELVRGMDDGATGLSDGLPSEGKAVSLKQGRNIKPVQPMRKTETAQCLSRPLAPPKASPYGGAAPAVPDEAVENISAKITKSMLPSERAQMASDKNQVMDELLNQPEIPADYGMQMVALFRDSEQDVVTRDFAVQHIGLYAEALDRRGVYNADSVEAHDLRAALDEASAETKTIVAAAAFRALADMAAFDPNVDVRRLDARLASCAADATASPAARVMAVQLCGERRVVSARPALAALTAARAAPEPLRRSALHAIKVLGRLD